MKCDARIIYYKKLTKNGKKRIFTTLSSDWDLIEWSKSLPESVWGRIDFTDIKECGGKVIANIGCHEEPGYGEEYSTWAELDVEFKCDSCGHAHYPNLPNQHNISDWLNKILDEIP